MQVTVQQQQQEIAAHPRDSLLWVRLARTYAELQQPAKAMEAAQRAEKMSGKTPEVQHALALFYAQLGNRKRAAELELDYARSNPGKDTFAAARAAFLCAESGLLKEAVEMGEIAVNRQDRGDIRALLAKTYESFGKPEKALEQYRGWLKLEPYNEQAYSEFGGSLLRLGRFTEAVPMLEDARSKFDKSPQILLALGVAYYGQRRFEDAAIYFLKVIDLSPDVEQPYVFLAKMLDQLGPQLPDVLARFAAWNDLEKRNPLPPFVYAKALLAAGQSKDQAEALLRESIHRDDKLWEAHFELATLLEQKQDWNGSRLELERAVALSPQQAAAYYRLARVYDRLELPAKAAEARKKHASLVAGEKLKNGMAVNE